MNMGLINMDLENIVKKELFNDLNNLIKQLEKSTGRSGELIRNSLKTIITRLSRDYIIKELNSMGVNVCREDSDTLLSIILKVCDFCNTASPRENAKICELVGGLFQLNMMKEIMKLELEKKHNLDNKCDEIPMSDHEFSPKEEVHIKEIMDSLSRTSDKENQAIEQLTEAIKGCKPGYLVKIYIDNAILCHEDVTLESSKVSASNFMLHGYTFTPEGTDDFVIIPPHKIKKIIITKII
jgi:hypothetical protein